jgi:hypothetical protein
VVYRANTPRRLAQLAEAVQLEALTLLCIQDPTYFAFYPLLFRLSAWLSRLTPPGMAEHLVGVYQKR